MDWTQFLSALQNIPQGVGNLLGYGQTPQPAQTAAMMPQFANVGAATMPGNQNMYGAAMGMTPQAPAPVGFWGHAGNLAGQALGDLGLVRAFQGGQLPQIMAQRQAAGTDPASRSALATSPFLAGLQGYGVSGGQVNLPPLDAQAPSATPPTGGGGGGGGLLGGLGSLLGGAGSSVGGGGGPVGGGAAGPRPTPEMGGVRMAPMPAPLMGQSPPSKHSLSIGALIAMAAAA